MAAFYPLERCQLTEIKYKKTSDLTGDCYGYDNKQVYIQELAPTRQRKRSHEAKKKKKLTCKSPNEEANE
jgi:hypothetical protein